MTMTLNPGVFCYESQLHHAYALSNVDPGVSGVLVTYSLT